MTIATQSVGAFEVRVWREGAGSPLWYLHGFETHPGGASVLRALAADRQLVAPEHPGYGESTGFEQIDEMLDLVLFYRQLVEASEPAGSRIDLIGHSLGGMIAAEFAALCPHLVRRLILVDPYGLWLDEDPCVDPFVLSAEELERAKWHDPEQAANEPSIFTPAPDDANGAVLERAKNLSVATKYLWPIPDRGLRKRLPLISAPTLIVQGESDGLIPTSYAERFASLIPDASVALIGEAGHLPMFEREEAFLEVVRPFLAD